MCFVLLAILAVIAIHTIPFQSHAHNDSTLNTALYFGINQAARFAVPFFFIISGFFWAKKVLNGSKLTSTSLTMTKRIVLILLAWNVFYLLPYNLAGFYEHGILGPVKLAYWKVTGFIEDPHYFLLQGSRVHLWFLISLIIALVISTAFVYFNKPILLLGIAFVLYCLGVLAKAYSDTPLGLSLDFNTRNGPFFSTLFFVLGYFLAQYQPNHRWLYFGTAIFFAGLILQASEVYLIWKIYGSSLEQDYVFGTILIGLGATIAALSNHPIIQIPSLAKIGAMTLGVYAVHFVFVDWLKPLDQYLNHAVWEIGYVVLVFVLSITTVWIIAQHPFGKRIVT